MTTCKKEWILLCCLVVAAACQREPVGGTDPGVKEVNTQFVFNIATSATQTKQEAAAVQEGEHPTFRGISDAKLMSYSLDNDGQILTEDKNADKLYDVSQLLTGGNTYRRVLEMSFPLQTNTLLMYGRAPQVTSGKYSSLQFSAKDYYGYLDKYTVTDKIGTANFQLGKRLQDEEGFYAMEKLIAGVLTVIMNTSMTTATQKEDIAEDGFSLKKEDYPDLWWSMYYKPDQNNDTGKSPISSSKDRYPLEEKLGHLYKEMTTIHQSTTSETELRAGSGEANLRVVQDLWSVVNAVRCATPLSVEEAVAKAFAKRIHAHLQVYFEGTVSDEGTPVTGVKFKDVKEISAHLLGGSYGGTAFGADIYWPQISNISDYRPVEQDDIDNFNAAIGSMNPGDFPGNFGIMHGAAYMNFMASDYCFYYPEFFNTSAVGGIPGDATSGYSARSYYYPAEILYFGNSPLRTSNKEHKTSDYPESISAWNSSSSWEQGTEEDPDWTGTHVTSTTRSVAMRYPIRYGVSMLETKVGYNVTALSNGYISDNNHAVQEKETGKTLDAEVEPDKKIAIKDNSFKLVGVVVGGQPQNVGWDFLPLPIGEEGNKKIVTGFIYDKAVVNQKIPKGDGSGFSSNYTVVFDNYNESGYNSHNPETSGDYGQDKVYVALEFQNNTGEDFYGNFNLIRNGGYFYLIGELDPTQATSGGFSWPTDGYVIPPYKYDNDGNYIGIPRVFIQDYKTSVTFKFGPNSLKYAYLTVPDLRASSLTMGLSVDIEWKQGLEYDEVVIGGN